jgi:hypothetical protein
MRAIGPTLDEGSNTSQLSANAIRITARIMESPIPQKRNITRNRVRDLRLDDCVMGTVLAQYLVYVGICSNSVLEVARDPEFFGSSTIQDSAAIPKFG